MKKKSEELLLKKMKLKSINHLDISKERSEAQNYIFSSEPLTPLSESDYEMLNEYDNRVRKGISDILKGMPDMPLAKILYTIPNMYTYALLMKENLQDETSFNMAYNTCVTLFSLVEPELLIIGKQYGFDNSNFETINPFLYDKEGIVDILIEKTELMALNSDISKKTFDMNLIYKNFLDILLLLSTVIHLI